MSESSIVVTIPTPAKEVLEESMTFGSPETLVSITGSPKKKNRRLSKKRKSIKARRLSIGVHLQPSTCSAPLRSKSVACASPEQEQAVIIESKSEVLPARSSPPAIVAKCPQTARRPTQPRAPQFTVEKRLQAHPRVPPTPSAEALVAKLEQETKKKREEMKKAQMMYMKLKKNGFRESTQSAVTTQKKITIPKTPQSKLDKKYGKRVPSILRSSPKKKAKKSKASIGGPTIPEPFHFATDQRLSNGNTTGSASMGSAADLTAAELAQKFMADTRSFAMPVTAAPTGSPKGPTVPHSPRLQTEIRAKSAQKTRPPSKQEQEAAEMDAIQSKPFKARALNRRILYESHGEIGVPKVPPKPLTEPVEFQFTYDKVREKHQQEHPTSATVHEEVPASAFKARPVPSHMKDGPAPLPQKREAKLTMPMSPKMNGGERASSAPLRRQKPHHKDVEAAKVQQQQQEKQAQQQQAHNRPLTQPVEFQLRCDVRGAHHQAQLEEKLARERALAQQYIALQQQQRLRRPPAPNKAASIPPKPAAKECTVPTPFVLQSVAKHQEAQERLQQQVHAEVEHEQVAKQFKAKPLPKTTFEPEPSRQTLASASGENVENQHQLVIPMNIVLESELRAEKRRVFDEHVAQKTAEQEAMKQEAQLRKVQEEEREVKMLRRKPTAEGGMAFKAAPVTHTSMSASAQSLRSSARSGLAATQAAAAGSVLAGGARKLVAGEKSASKMTLIR